MNIAKDVSSSKLGIVLKAVSDTVFEVDLKAVIKEKTMKEESTNKN